tara:strand:+ start:214 stop:918 length:705 start_codon:yes stop_codon:yes gene_type:complete
MNKIYFLILANNEVKTIEKEIYKILKLSKKLNFKLVVVQDGSTDGTFELLEKISKKNKIILFNKKKRLGYYNAFLKGVKLCKGNTIFFSDTGNKYEYSKFLQFYKFYKNNNSDLVSGYRIKRKDKILRRILTYVYSLTINVIFQINYRDYDCGFKIFNRKKLLKILKSNSFEKNLITSQIFLYFIINKYRINQYPIIYKEKKTRNSRGIPTKKIFNVVLTAILNLIKIRLNFKL